MKFAKNNICVPYLKDNPQLQYITGGFWKQLKKAFYDDCYNMSITIEEQTVL